jgi:maltose O-acetyltransferase
VRLQGKAIVTNHGSIVIGDRVRLQGTIIPIELVAFGGALTIGEGTYINYGTNISTTESVTIGRNCAIGQYAIIMDDDYHAVDDHQQPGKRAPIVIEDDVWIGARAIVLRGTHVGRGAVIGANSVVRGEIPPRTIAAGSPARVIKPVGGPPDGDG